MLNDQKNNQFSNVCDILYSRKKLYGLEEFSAHKQWGTLSDRCLGKSNFLGC